jgi:predicted MFS family arabinose efflux permease
MSARPVSERAVVFVIGAVQFFNILDFMMVMPLGPDFALGLGLPLSHLGYVAGSYTAAAAVSGLAGSFFLDRFDRRRALLVALTGLALATLAGGFATGLSTLLAARLLAGFFGGPATSLSLSIIADLVPPERRGRAMGAVMSAFSIAAVLGVPIGLKLSLWGGWRTPFLAVGALGLLLTALAAYVLPNLRAHLEANRRPGSLGGLVRKPEVLLSWTMTAVVMSAGFTIIPNLAAYLQHNLDFPREQLGTLYLFGGIASYAMMRLGGPAVDRFGSFAVGAFAALTLVGIHGFGFFEGHRLLAATPLFIAFTAMMSLRNVAHHTLASKVPAAHERARFMSIQSAVQHLASAAGAFGAARVLTEGAGGRLEGMGAIAALAMGLTAALPGLMYLVERRVIRRPAAPAPPLEPQTGLSSPTRRA